MTARGARAKAGGGKPAQVAGAKRGTSSSAAKRRAPAATRRAPAAPRGSAPAPSAARDRRPKAPKPTGRDGLAFFATFEQWHAWLAEHHANGVELWVGFHKRHTGAPSLTWPQSVDGALCFGWIDGVRYRVDDDAYKIRFTPRKAGSTWSAVNIRRVAELRALKLMHPAGEAAFARRSEAKSGIYAYEQRPVELPAPWLGRLKRNKAAWAFFSSQAPWYRRTATWWVISAKKDETKAKRFAQLLADSTSGLRIASLRRTEEKSRAKG